MGYDMKTRIQPERIKEIDARLFDGDYAAIPEAEREALWTERSRIQDETLCYFGLNISGMRQYRNHMEALGMLEWSDEQHPPFKDYSAFGVPMVDVEYRGKTYQEPDRDSPEYKAHLEDQERTLAWTGSDTTVINGHKLCDNSGWLVTPKEIAGALEVYRKLKEDNPELIDEVVGEDNDDGYWDRWIAFLATACEGGGFEVH
jgi:hypothetical protein